MEWCTSLFYNLNILTDVQNAFIIDGHPITLHWCSWDKFQDIIIYIMIISGGRTEETAVNIATLSGSLDLAGKTFTSASNFMIIKFRSDEVFSYFLKAKIHKNLYNLSIDYIGLFSILRQIIIKISRCCRGGSS